MGYSFLMLRFPRGCGERNNPVEARIARPLSGGIRASASTHQPKPPLEGRCHGEAMTERCNCRGGYPHPPADRRFPPRPRRRRGSLYGRPCRTLDSLQPPVTRTPLRRSNPSNAGGNCLRRGRRKPGGSCSAANRLEYKERAWDAGALFVSIGITPAPGGRARPAAESAGRSPRRCALRRRSRPLRR